MHLSLSCGFGRLSLRRATPLLLGAALWAPLAHALPLGAVSDQERAEGSAAALGLTEDGSDFSAAIALNGCSGALVRFTTSQPTDHALALTNGHCYELGPLHAGEVLVDKPSYRDFKLLRPDGSKTLALLRVDRLLYATMTGTDVALYRLVPTYADIEQRYGTEALTIADHQLEAGSAIRVVSGFWKQIYACSVDGFVPQLREGEWLFTNAMRYSAEGCPIIPGTSGSPVIDPASGALVGINNTRNRDGERCTENNPCEVDASGQITVLKGRGYAEEVYPFYSCLGADRSIDLGLPGCTLASPQR